LAGIFLVVAAVFGLFSRKHHYVLLRPPELRIMCGCALGIILIFNRPSLIRKVA
jgi:hypothetical protein